MAVGRGVGDIFRFDVRVGELDLLGQRVVGREGIEHSDGCQTTQRDGCGAVEKLPSAELSMSVEVVQLEQFGRKIFGC